MVLELEPVLDGVRVALRSVAPVVPARSRGVGVVGDVHEPLSYFCQVPS
jgi:hypothetical protein